MDIEKIVLDHDTKLKIAGVWLASNEKDISKVQKYAKVQSKRITGLCLIGVGLSLCVFSLQNQIIKLNKEIKALKKTACDNVENTERD